MGDWRGGETDVRHLLARLYRSSTNLLADIQFVCGDRQPVWAHKLVLALASQYFQDLFYPRSKAHQATLTGWNVLWVTVSFAGFSSSNNQPAGC